jgi:hypothetical protein
MTSPAINHFQFIIYQTEDGETKLDVRFENETVWLTQKLMAELFSTTPENILMYLKNILVTYNLQLTCRLIIS